MLIAVIFFSLIVLGGCGSFSDKAILSKHADALLTKNNEIQFRFRINSQLIESHQLFKVKVRIHDDGLAAAIGKQEIVYGEEQVVNGEYIDANSDGEKYIYMDPIPLKEDIHIQDLQVLIEQKKAVSIEVFDQKRVLARSYLTNFSSEL